MKQSTVFSNITHKKLTIVDKDTLLLIDFFTGYIYYLVYSMSAYQVLTIPELLRNITAFHTDKISLFIKHGRTSDIYHRIKTISIDCPTIACRIVKTSDIKLLEVLYHDNAKSQTFPWFLVAEYAMRVANLPVMQWVYDQIISKTGLSFFPNISDAIMKGKLSFIKWVHAHHIIGLDTYHLNLAAECGHLDIIQFIFGTGVPASKFAIDLAAGNGHLDVVMWLGDNGNQCTTKAIDLAITNGHIDVADWLHKQTLRCTYEAVAMAIRRKQTHVVEWVIANCPEFSLDKLLSTTISTLNMKAIRYFCQAHPNAITAISIRNAIKTCNTEIVGYILEMASREDIQNAIDSLMASRNYTETHWFRANFRDFVATR